VKIIQEARGTSKRKGGQESEGKEGKQEQYMKERNERIN